MLAVVVVVGPGGDGPVEGPGAVPPSLFNLAKKLRADGGGARALSRRCFLLFCVVASARASEDTEDDSKGDASVDRMRDTLGGMGAVLRMGITPPLATFMVLLLLLVPAAAAVLVVELEEAAPTVAAVTLPSPSLGSGRGCNTVRPKVGVLLVVLLLLDRALTLKLGAPGGRGDMGVCRFWCV